jgi:hypothetical protein
MIFALLCAAAITLGGLAATRSEASTANPARHLAARWIADLQRGDFSAACALQTDRSPERADCASLSPVAYACPGQIPSNEPLRIPARRPARQILSLRVDSGRAFVPLTSEDRSVRGKVATAMLSATPSGWLVDTVKRRGKFYDLLAFGQPPSGGPGASAYDLYPRLFITGCVMPVFK